MKDGDNEQAEILSDALMMVEQELEETRKIVITHVCNVERDMN